MLHRQRLPKREAVNLGRERASAGGRHKQEGGGGGHKQEGEGTSRREEHKQEGGAPAGGEHQQEGAAQARRGAPAQDSSTSRVKSRAGFYESWSVVPKACGPRVQVWKA